MPCPSHLHVTTLAVSGEEYKNELPIASLPLDSVILLSSVLRRSKYMVLTWRWETKFQNPYKTTGEVLAL
jgi:hypothetical protein